MRIIIAFSIKVRKHFDEERAKESDGEREREREYNKNESRTKTFCVVVFVVQKSFSLRPYSTYFSKVLSLRVCSFFLRSRFRVFIDDFFSIFISLLFEMIDTKKKTR